jgi:hypothetical protein
MISQKKRAFKGYKNWDEHGSFTPTFDFHPHRNRPNMIHHDYPPSYSALFGRECLHEYHNHMGFPTRFGGLKGPLYFCDDRCMDAVEHNPSPPEETKLRVGIIGAGVAGLYTAMILESLGIEYEILEAQGDHIGGRLLTHHFSTGENDYYVTTVVRIDRSVRC